MIDVTRIKVHYCILLETVYIFVVIPGGFVTEE